jgi:DNA-binding MarR family transcriptional regulator
VSPEAVDGPGPEVTQRLGYLLKHATATLDELSVAALESLGVTPQELGILVLLDSNEPASQQDAARRLGVDRTTMVSRLDRLETLGLVGRHADAADRRRNVVELTGSGQRLLRDAKVAAAQAEAALLAPLSARQAEQMRDALHRVVTGAPLG